jgi:hypothetical protein
VSDLYRFNSVAKISLFFISAKEIEKNQEKFSIDFKNF